MRKVLQAVMQKAIAYSAILLVIYAFYLALQDYQTYSPQYTAKVVNTLSQALNRVELSTTRPISSESVAGLAHSDLRVKMLNHTAALSPAKRFSL